MDVIVTVDRGWDVEAVHLLSKTERFQTETRVTATSSRRRTWVSKV